ncbi:hypothetical protein [Burkholderia ambifaria]|uniref:hypothetical protein n=1 Tax=Burkholderia ambifaria TaxID=152480 RepID=UPI00158F22C8|nr:hypothetical protein [Burkholderia ambifaria]
MIQHPFAVQRHVTSATRVAPSVPSISPRRPATTPTHHDLAGCDAYSPRRSLQSVASMFPQCIIFVATRAFIACVRIRLVDGGTNQGQFRGRIIRSISRIWKCIRSARITCAHNDSCSNFDHKDDTSLHVDLQFIAPAIAGAANSACIASRCGDLQASTGRIDRPDARSTNKKACTVRSRRHGRQNSEECRGAASSKGQSII